MHILSLNERFELYLDTLEKCGLHLLEQSDELISLYIFEYLDISIRSFLCNDNLQKFLDEVMIDEEIFRKSTLLRSSFLKLQETELWNIEAVRKSTEWKGIFESSDEIKRLLKEEKEKFKIYYPDIDI